MDLRAVLPMKVRDQGDINWCYAHTAADYLQFYEGIQEPISAADIAIHYNLHFWPKIFRFFTGDPVPETGFLRAAIWDAMGDGYCPESRFPSDAWKKVYPSSSGRAAEWKRLNASIADLFLLQDRIERGFYRSASELPFAYEFNGVSPDRFFAILRDVKQQGILNALRMEVCAGNRRPYPKDISAITMRLRSASASDRIHEALGAGMPLSVDYFYGVLEHADSYSHAISELHTSLLMGQRFDPGSGECQFLVKNSFGTSCSGYDPRWECQAGYLWVGESALHRAMISEVTIQP